MEVILLGTGGPRPDPDRMGPSTLIITGSENIIVDAGRGVSSRLIQAGVSITEFGYVFITHHHFDHISGLADLLFSAWNKARNRTIHVYGPKGTMRMVGQLFEAYERDIWYRLTEAESTVENLVDIREMVVVHDLEPGVTVYGEDWMAKAEYVDHGYGFTHEDWPCLAYRFTSGESSLVITGDAVTSRELVDFSRGADMLITCCYLAGEEIVDHDTELISKYVLMSSTMAGKFATMAGVDKLVLIHIREKPWEVLQSMVKDIRKDYLGEIIVGEDLLRVKLV